MLKLSTLWRRRIYKLCTNRIVRLRPAAEGAAVLKLRGTSEICFKTPTFNSNSSETADSNLTGTVGKVAHASIQINQRSHSNNIFV